MGEGYQPRHQREQAVRSPDSKITWDTYRLSLLDLLHTADVAVPGGAGISYELDGDFLVVTVKSETDR
jgi:hypothetical protein